ncbi:hypothetical protein [Dapis sp. BLCC M172]
MKIIQEYIIDQTIEVGSGFEWRGTGKEPLNRFLEFCTTLV